MNLGGEIKFVANPPEILRMRCLDWKIIDLHDEMCHYCQVRVLQRTQTNLWICLSIRMGFEAGFPGKGKPHEVRRLQHLETPCIATGNVPNMEHELASQTSRIPVW